MPIRSKAVLMLILMDLSAGLGTCFGQNATLEGRVLTMGRPVYRASISLAPGRKSTLSDTSGRFYLSGLEPRRYSATFSCVGFEPFTLVINLVAGRTHRHDVSLKEKANAMDEVVVTGSVQGSRVITNPLAIMLVQPKAIERSSESNVIDVLSKNAPGLTVVKTGPNISKPFIRGLGYYRVLTQYDGIRQEGQQWGDEHGIEVDAYNIDRAEVIKGPASLLYGSDAMAVLSCYRLT